MHFFWFYKYKIIWGTYLLANHQITVKLTVNIQYIPIHSRFIYRMYLKWSWEYLKFWNKCRITTDTYIHNKHRQNNWSWPKFTSISIIIDLKSLVFLLTCDFQICALIDWITHIHFSFLCPKRRVCWQVSINTYKTILG